MTLNLVFRGGRSRDDIASVLLNNWLLFGCSGRGCHFGGDNRLRRRHCFHSHEIFSQRHFDVACHYAQLLLRLV